MTVLPPHPRPSNSLRVLATPGHTEPKTCPRPMWDRSDTLGADSTHGSPSCWEPVSRAPSRPGAPLSAAHSARGLSELTEGGSGPGSSQPPPHHVILKTHAFLCEGGFLWKDAASTGCSFLIFEYVLNIFTLTPSNEDARTTDGASPPRWTQTGRSPSGDLEREERLGTGNLQRPAGSETSDRAAVCFPSHPNGEDFWAIGVV